MDRWTDSPSKQDAPVQSAGIEFTEFWTDGQIGQVFYSFLEKNIHIQPASISLFFFLN